MMLIAAMDTSSWARLLFLAVGLLALWGVWLLATGSGRSTEIRGRGELGVARRRRIDEVVDGWVRRTGWGSRVNERLVLGGVEWSAGRFMLVAVGAALGAFLVAQLLFPAVIATAAGLFAFYSAFSWLDRKVEKRKELFVGQLPDIARLMSNGAAAGLSVPASIELTVREITAPADRELQLVLDEISLGSGVEPALESLQKRLPSREIAVLITTLIIQQRSGGDAVHALQELAQTLDQRRQTLREVGTLLAGAVVTSYLVPLLGLGSLLMLNTINSQTLHRMTTNPIGIVTLVVCGVMFAVGSLLIRRTTRIEL